MPEETYSFVVRVWKEGLDTVGQAAGWRGSIDNVLTGERSYISDLDKISQVIRAELGLTWRGSLVSGEHEAGDGQT